MSKSFTDFLVEEGILSPSDIVEAYIHQGRENFCLAKIIADNQLLNTEQIVQVFRSQAEKHISFSESCQELGFWTSELEQKIEAAIIRDVPSIFTSLVAQNKVSMEDLTHKLDEFISHVIDNPDEYSLKQAS